MIFELKINCDNAAFADGNAAPEVSRILEHLSILYRELDAVVPSVMPLRDINGNNVGYARFTKGD